MDAKKGQKKRLLIVDDAPQWTSFVKNLLGSENFEFIEAIDGVDALEKLKALKQPVDAVLTDTNMPRMDGVELLKQLQKAQPNLKVLVFFSGHQDPNITDSVIFSLGAQMVLPKDTENSELAKAVFEICSLKKN